MCVVSEEPYVNIKVGLAPELNQKVPWSGYRQKLKYTQVLYVTVTGSNFEITFVLEKHMVEDDVLFTNHLAGK